MNEVTVYSPFSAGLYRRSIRKAGGAERQMMLLAQELARRGHPVALVLYPVDDPIPHDDPNLRLVERAPHTGTGGLRSLVAEALHVWRALRDARGRVVVVRTGTPVVGVIAIYALITRTSFVFSSANDFDFEERSDRSRLQERLYAFGVRRANAVVVQSVRQVELAGTAFPGLRRLVRIPSFADDASAAAPVPGTYFLWAGRLIDYKRPLLFTELAAAVPEARFLMIPHVGNSPNPDEVAILDAINAAAESLDNLEIGRSQPHADLLRTLAASVAMVNTSEYEGMPNTFLEAWGQGVPVLTLSFDPDGVVAEQSLGISAAGSWDAFVDGARALWEAREERDETASRVKSYLRATHSMQAVGDRWEAILHEVGAFDVPSAAPSPES